ncbi:MAG: tetratricopeptide repeat protein, partial [Acidobacteria bacterium]
TRQFQEQHKLQMVGIIEEQHPDRARLFMQWKQMSWPVMVDSLNLLEVPYVPITLAIDEHGIIRKIQPSLTWVEQLPEEFLDRSFPEPSNRRTEAGGLPDLGRLKQMTRNNTATAWREYAHAAFLWGGPDRLDEAIAAYQRALALEPEDGYTWFRLGVAYRRRYDSSARRPGDFQRAIDAWAKALRIDPNNYIWRRRIQQYGPRLKKPYPFYDWVSRARRDIRARGEIPVPLAIEPRGAELARPARQFLSTNPPEKEPDPNGRIHRDRGRFIQVETVVVPPEVAPGGVVRAHVIFRPNDRRKAHWNNEAGDVVFWVHPPQGWAVDRQYQTIPSPSQPVSREPRQVEFEIRCPEDARPGTVSIPGYALYYVCEDVNGVCLYRRQDVILKVRVRKKPAL